MQRRDFLAGSTLGLAAGTLAAAEVARPQNLRAQGPAGGRRVMFHCHTFPAQGTSFAAGSDAGPLPGSPEHLAAFSRELGFDRAVALSPFEVPLGRCTSRVDEGTDGAAWLSERAEAFGERLIRFASLDPTRPESASRLEKLAGRGFAGVKFHPVICRFSLDADRDEHFYGTLERLGLPLLIHTGVFSGYGQWPLESYHPLLIDRIAGKYPKIPIIMAHCGGAAFCRDVLAVVQSHDRAYFDLTHTLDPKYAWYIPRADYEFIFERVGTGRVLYGVDYPWYSREDCERDLKTLDSLGIRGRDLDRLLGENFLGLTEASSG